MAQDSKVAELGFMRSQERRQRLLSFPMREFAEIHCSDQATSIIRRLKATLEDELFEVSSLTALSESTIDELLGGSLVGAQGLKSLNASMTSRYSNKGLNLSIVAKINIRIHI